MPARPELVVIAAIARNGVIGRDNQLPWHLPEDLKHFRATTAGSPVLMGHRTWDSLPARFRPLPGRRNLVITRQPAWQAEGAETVATLDAALAQPSPTGRLFVIGGAQLWASALPQADTLVLTELEFEPDGDTRFPPWDRGAFDEVARERHHAAAPNDFDFAFVTYRRRR